MDAIIHFGIRYAPRKQGLKLTRENYANISNKSSFGKNRIYIRALQENDKKTLSWYSGKYEDREGLIYTEEWCKKQYEEAIQNFDLNMKFFQSLDKSEFDSEIEKFLKKEPFIEVKDLNPYSCPGYYAMILDEYCQIYIGTTQNIQKRIRQHWQGGKPRFDRLIFGDVKTSKISINSFKILDTTRILIYKTNDLYNREDDYINCFSDKFICNRLKGGIKEPGTLDALLSIKNRQL